MPGLPAGRAVSVVLRCYPRRWRRRHGAEAAELAALLIADGVPAHSIACSYFWAAARAWLTPPPGRRLAAAVAALLIAAGSLGVPLGLLSASAPASAASATRTHSASPNPASPSPASPSPASPSPASPSPASPGARATCTAHPHSHSHSHSHPHSHSHSGDDHGQHC